MELRSLIDIPWGTPLSKIIKVPNSDLFLSSSAYRIDHEIYLGLSPFRPGSLEKDPSGPFATGVVWAVSDGALRRALLMEIEADDGATASAPEDLLPENGATTYSTILKGLRNAKPRVCQEKAAYRIASDGLFVHRIIETEQFSFFFRKVEHDDSDLPYVIVRKLT